MTLHGVDTFGPPDGAPVFYFHGWPGSRLEARLAASILDDVGVRIIALDRPGAGLVPWEPGFRILDWPHRVEACARALGIDRYSILAVSGGAPFALACGKPATERLACIVLASPTVPYDRLRGRVGFPFNAMDRVHRTAPRLLRAALSAAAAATRVTPADLAFLAMSGFSPPADRRVFADRRLRRLLMRNAREAFRQGGDAVMRQGELLQQSWPFELGEIAVPVQAWHGGNDTVIPVAAARAYYSTGPALEWNELPEEAHFSLPVRYLRTLLLAARGA